MENTYTYKLKARSAAFRGGVIEGVPDALDFSSPPEFGGEPGFWTPEDFFLAALAGCFVSTFQSVAAHSKFEFLALEVCAKGTLSKEEGGFRFTEVILTPRLTLHDEASRERALRLLEKSERACLVARSLNTKITLVPELLMVAEVAAGD